MTGRDFIPWARPSLSGNEAAYVARALESTWISGGEYVERLETEIGALCRSRFAVSASSGTGALHLALLGLGVGPGDEIVVPGFAFLAAANLALHLGARPVFAEVDESTWCATASTIEPRLSERTRAIVAVHTYGNLCPMDGILALARERGVPVIEDAAEALGSRLNGRPAGGMGDVGCFSFQATKTITTGEGGLAATNDPDLAERMRLYRNHGMERVRYWHEVPGLNFRLTNLQAALGCAQLEAFDRIAGERARVRGAYLEQLSGQGGLAVQAMTPGVEPLLWAMAVRLERGAFEGDRDHVAARLAEQGIETRPGFYPPGPMGIYGEVDLPACERLSAEVLSLPTFPTLGDDEIEFVCGRLKALRR